MSLFHAHTDYYNIGDPEKKIIDIVDFICDYFKPDVDNAYYIMDPYLDVIHSIQDRFIYSKIDEGIWSILISELAFNNAIFHVITRQSIEGLRIPDKYPPYNIPFRGSGSNVTIQACKYVDSKYCGMDLHDRYILRESKDKNITGVHIGPSLDDMRDKDVSVTLYENSAAKKALKSFKMIWSECVNRREWKTN